MKRNAAPLRGPRQLRRGEERGRSQQVGAQLFQERDHLSSGTNALGVQAGCPGVPCTPAPPEQWRCSHRETWPGLRVTTAPLSSGQGRHLSVPALTPDQRQSHASRSTVVSFLPLSKFCSGFNSWVVTSGGHGRGPLQCGLCTWEQHRQGQTESKILSFGSPTEALGFSPNVEIKDAAKQ